MTVGMESFYLDAILNADFEYDFGRGIDAPGRKTVTAIDGSS